MRSWMLSSVVLLVGCVAGNAAQTATAELGQPAPDFTLTGLDGAAWTLSEHADETVVLEWFNPGCPFVVYAHGDPAGPLASMAAKTDGVTWVAINSGAPGKQGHGVEANKKALKDWAMSHPVLIDEDGTVGKTYGAATTPHMYIVHEGTLVYNGAIDNQPLGKGDGTRVNYVADALKDIKAGNPVSRPQTKPYGCSVKY